MAFSFQFGGVTALDSVSTRSVAASSLTASSHPLVVSSSMAFNSSPARLEKGSGGGGARSEHQEADKLATSVEKLQQTN